MPSKSVFIPDGGIHVSFHPRILGTPAPVFPGYEIDIHERTPDDEKPDAVWHRERARSMLKAHPEIKTLFGNTPSTAWWCLSVCIAHTAVAFLVGWQPWWVMLLAAYLFGGLAAMNLFILAHECNHSLVFKSQKLNRLLYTITCAPMFMSAHHTWWIEHHIHHKDLGAKKDFIKRRRTFFLLARSSRCFGRTEGWIYKAASGLQTPLFLPYALMMLIMQTLRSTFGLLYYIGSALISRQLRPSDKSMAILADEHLIKGYDRYRIRGWAVLFPLVNLGLVIVVALVAGWKGVAYLLLSQLFATGFLHPVMLGIILSNSHFHGHDCYQPSSSYYKWFNWLTFHFGLHTEHHDFMNIAWSRLPKLRQMAPEFYDDLVKTPSYNYLSFQYAFGQRKNFDYEVARNIKILPAEFAANDSSTITPNATGV